jgi:hypothetical protein
MDTTPLILTGPPGCGKSHWIQEYATKTKKQLFVCPCRKDRTLRDGRQKLHVWARRTEPAILWLEGADDLTPEAQAFLRRILETHASEVLFILECRDAGRLQEPIRSRCQIRTMRVPTKLQMEHYLCQLGVLPQEVLDYLTPNQYSYRRAKQCAYLQSKHPERWAAVREHRKQEQHAVEQLSVSNIMEYIQEGYHPETLLYSLMKDESVLKDYGNCIEVSGSLWALLAYVMERRAFDMVSTTPHKEEE